MTRPAGRRLALVVVVVATVVAGCVRDPSTIERSPSPVAVASPSDAPSPPSDGGDVSADADAAATRDAVFLSTVEVALLGTVHEGLVDEQPGELLGLRTAVCGRLGAGATVDEVLTVVLESLAADADSPQDDVVLAGAVLGAGVETGCPQHAALLD